MKQYCGGGCTCRPSAILFLTAFLFFLAAPPRAIAQTYDVLVVEKTGHLIVYDSFQQSLTPLQQNAFKPFVPMKILRAQDVLGDGLTRCMKIEVDGNVFFLLRDEGGKLAGWRDLGAVRTFAEKAFIDDTIAVRVSGEITLRNPVDGKVSPLVAGDRCVRYFDEAGAVYVQRMGNHRAYGWITISAREEGKWWRIVRTETSHAEFSAALRERINTRIRQANQTLSEVYTHLNRESGKALSAPQFHVDPRAQLPTYILLPDSTAFLFTKSIEALASALQGYLLGTDFDAFAAGNKIEIKPR